MTLLKDPIKLEMYKKLCRKVRIARGFSGISRKNVIGRTFNMLTTLKIIKTKKNPTLGLFKCKCGKEKVMDVSKVVRGITKSCGCLYRGKVIHGMARHKGESDFFKEEDAKFYQTWSDMKQRCNNKKNKYYFRYGERGIKICDKWETFINFKNDMYQSYLKHIKKYGGKDTSLDRTNNNGNYEPSNCRWATYKEQNNNRDLKREGRLVKDKIYIVCGKYETGWEEIFTATTKEEAMTILKDYRKNEPNYLHKLKVKFEK